MDGDNFWYGICGLFFFVCTVMQAAHGHWITAWVCFGLASACGRLVWAELRPAPDELPPV